MTRLTGKMFRENLGPTRTITIYLTEEVIKALDKYARSHNFNNRSWAVEELLKKTLPK